MKKNTKRLMAASLAFLLTCLLIVFGPGKRALNLFPTLTDLGTMHIKAYRALVINSWELDNALSFSYSPPTGLDLQKGFDLQTGQEMTEEAYEALVERTLGLRQLHRRHFPWEQVPVPLQLRVLKSLNGKMPHGTVVADCCFSPRKDRIAWRVTYWSTPPFLDPLKHWFSAYEKLAVPMAALWITDGNGEYPRLIGEQAGEHDKEFRDPGESPWKQTLVHDVIWSPREDQLGFVYNNNFYTIPVPK